MRTITRPPRPGEPNVEHVVVIGDSGVELGCHPANLPAAQLAAAAEAKGAVEDQVLRDLKKREINGLKDRQAAENARAAKSWRDVMAGPDDPAGK